MSFQEEQINEEHIVEIQALIHKNPEGLTFTQLFDKLSSIPEQTDLSKCLHEASKRKICAKIDGKYFPHGHIKVVPSIGTEVTTQEIRDLLSKNPETSAVMGEVGTPEQQEATVVHTKVVPTEKQLTKVDPLPPSIPAKLQNGTLRRSGVSGKLAYALWRCRGEILDRKDLQLLVEDATSGSFYQAMLSLCQLEMVKRVGDNSAQAQYTWGDKYCYPFPNHLPDDKTLMPFNTHQEFLKWKQDKLKAKAGIVVEPDYSVATAPSEKIATLHSVPTMKPQEDKVIEAPRTNITDACELIKTRILHHENELSFLNNLLKSLSVP